MQTSINWQPFCFATAHCFIKISIKKTVLKTSVDNVIFVIVTSVLFCIVQVKHEGSMNGSPPIMAFAREILNFLLWISKCSFDICTRLQNRISGKDAQRTPLEIRFLHFMHIQKHSSFISLNLEYVNEPLSYFRSISISTRA